jgi:hypothetical protein
MMVTDRLELSYQASGARRHKRFYRLAAAT